MQRALSMMKAIRVTQFGGPEVLKVVSDVPVPKPTGSQVVVSVKAAGVNPVETYIRSGNYGKLPPLPFTPGSEGAGVISALGDKVTKFKGGERVYFKSALTGSYAQYALVDESNTHSLSERLSYSQGAGVGIPYYTAYRALVHRGGLRPGETVLVHGASGAVGLACCQIAHTLGARVLGTAGTAEGLQLVKDNQAAAVFNHRDEKYMEQIQAETGGRGVDLIVEMLANVNLEKDMTIAAQNGRIMVVGSRGTLEITPRLTMTRELSVKGVQLFGSTPAESAEAAAFLAAGQEVGWLRPVVGTEYSLDEAPEAHREVIAHTGGSRGKIVLNIGENSPKSVPL